MRDTSTRDSGKAAGLIEHGQPTARFPPDFP